MLGDQEIAKLRGCALIRAQMSNWMEMLWTRLYCRHKQISRFSVVLLSKWNIARRCFETRNETFWIVAPGIGVTMVMATIILLIGR